MSSFLTCSFNEGQPSRELFILVKGSVECSVINPASILHTFQSTATPDIMHALDGLRDPIAIQPSSFPILHSPPTIPLILPRTETRRTSSDSDSDSDHSDDDAVPVSLKYTLPHPSIYPPFVY